MAFPFNISKVSTALTCVVGLEIIYDYSKNSCLLNVIVSLSAIPSATLFISYSSCYIHLHATLICLLKNVYLNKIYQNILFT